MRNERHTKDNLPEIRYLLDIAYLDKFLELKYDLTYLVELWQYCADEKEFKARLQTAIIDDYGYLLENQL